MFTFYKLLLLVAGLINFIPVLGILSGERIAQAYGVDIQGNDLTLLLRHRALLFGLIGGFLLYSLFAPSMQWPAIIMATISMLGFLYLAWDLAPVNEQITKVVIADLVALACVVIAVCLRLSPLLRP